MFRLTIFIFSCLKNNQHDVTCGLSFIFVGSRHSLSTCFELSGSSSSEDHFSVQKNDLLMMSFPKARNM